jgi:UDP-glucose 4-epimerase
MRKKKIIITGGAGFIGSNLAEKMSNGNEVIILDDLSTGKFENVAEIVDKGNIRFIEGNILNSDLLVKLLNGVDIVFHEAAITSVTRSFENPHYTSDVNIMGTLNVLLAARANKVKKVIFASSSSVYGDSINPTKKETMLPKLYSFYALTKLTGEYYCDLFNRFYNLPTICLRYFNVYGPRQRPESQYAAVIPSFICRIMDNEPPIIYGDGNNTRDFVFVEDVIQANIIAAECDIKGIYNVGSGCSTRIEELARKVAKAMNKEIQPIYQKPNKGDIRRSLADISKIEALGYKPRYGLDDGLSSTIKWFLQKSGKSSKA